MASGDGHLADVSSLNGVAAQPSLSAYCASKFAVRGSTEVVCTEMLAAGHPVQAARIIVDGVEAGKDAVLVDRPVRLLAARWPSLVAKQDRKLFGAPPRPLTPPPGRSGHFGREGADG